MCLRKNKNKQRGGRSGFIKSAIYSTNFTLFYKKYFKLQHLKILILNFKKKNNYLTHFQEKSFLVVISTRGLSGVASLVG